MGKQEFSIPSLAMRVRTEADAYLLLEELRWNGSPVCPHCGSVREDHWYLTAHNGGRKTRTGKVSERRVWKCRDCRKQFTVLVGTIFHGTKIPLRTWVLVVFELCASKNGVSAREIERKYDLTPKTAWLLLHRIREAMKREPLAGLLAGTIIADETYIGGDDRNRHYLNKHGKGTHGRSLDKTPVLSLIHKESGEVRSRVVPNVKGGTLRDAILDDVEAAGSTLWTDKWKGYLPVADKFDGHETVDHSAWEYERDGISSNAVEGYFSQLKRSVDGTHHHVSAEHLPRYLAEFDYRWTTRKMTDAERFRLLLEQTDGRRLTYAPLTESD